MTKHYRCRLLKVIIAVLFNLSPDIGRFLPTVGAFVGLPLSVVGIVLSVLGLRSLFDKKTAITGLIICFITFILTLVFVLATLLSPNASFLNSPASSIQQNQADTIAETYHFPITCTLD